MQPRAAMRVKELEAELKAEQNRLSDDDGYVP
jgi:hypothetical protein